VPGEGSWSDASSLAGLCELGARFCAGEIDRFPGWMARELDEESGPLVQQLVALNRAGFLTVASQPGRPDWRGHDGRTWRNRAFVCGFASGSVARRLAQVGAGCEPVIDVFACDDASAGRRVPVGMRGADAYLYAGHCARDEELEIFAEHCTPEALAELGAACYISVYDPQWGRVEYLWQQLAEGLPGA